jgi:putative restriction endonuclease
MMESPRFWILKSKGKKSSFGGNNGYADELERFYLYDTTVKNHDKIKEGDYVLLVDKYHIKGSANIEYIEVTEDIPKQRFRCPECGTQELYSRSSISPKYKCRKKHEFEVPKVEDIIVTQYRALYSASFKPAVSKLSVKTLDGHYIKRNIYYSIQQADLSFITGGAADSSIQRKEQRLAQVKERGELVLPTGAYIPSGDDNRSFLITKVAARPSQDVFRWDLFRIYGIRCMVTGCDVATAIEASHICPYRGEKDNHPENGILLRRDLHALYDEDLIGIDPRLLTIRLSKAIKGSFYEQYVGQSLFIQDAALEPSRAALHLRWQIFMLKESN